MNPPVNSSPADDIEIMPDQGVWTRCIIMGITGHDEPNHNLGSRKQNQNK